MTEKKPEPINTIKPRIYKARSGTLFQWVLFGLLVKGALFGAAASATGTPSLTVQDSVVTEQPAETAPEPPLFVPNRTITLETLGARYPLSLRGVDASNSLPFSIRADEIVSGARLNLGYAYSPSLLPDLSHINILVNDEVAATIAVPNDTAGRQLTKTVDLPAHLITAFNQLRLQLIGHYTLECEDPLHSSLWANISNQSQLEFAVEPLPLPNDLALLPLPFFDHRDIRPLMLPFVFSGIADSNVLEGAGAISSWFGLLADHRRTRFPVQKDIAPSGGHAVIFINGAAQARHFYAEPLSGPTIAVAPNPQDPASKFLLIMGRDSTEMKQAALALASGSQALSGQSARVTQFADIKPRLPYDAPKWLRTDRPVAFGELINKQQLNVSGYSPDLIRLNLRVPPDLFGWREDKVPIHLKYRYTPQPTSVNSSLLFSVDDLFMKSMPLFALDDLYDEQAAGTEPLPDQDIPSQATLEVPLETLSPRAQLQFRYMYDYVKQGACRDIIIDNVRGYIDPESTIDLTAYPHFKAMPDLTSFTDSGWPFTRLADLSETAVILNPQASPQALGLYFDLMGLMGASTGYPALGVTVTSIEQVDTVSGKDLLVLTAGADQPALTYWSEDLAGTFSPPDGKQMGTSDLLYKTLSWPTPDPRDNKVPQRSVVAYDSQGVSAIVAGFESPKTPGRSVVLVASNDATGLEKAASAILKHENFEGAVGGSLSIIRTNTIDPLIADQTYYTGRLGYFKHLQWLLAPYMPAKTWQLLAAIAVLLLVMVVLLLRAARTLFRQRKATRHDI